MSKGSKRRPEKPGQYQDEWEKIFGKPKPKIKEHKNIKLSTLDDTILNSDLIVLLVAHNKFKEIKIDPNKLINSS